MHVQDPPEHLPFSEITYQGINVDDLIKSSTQEELLRYAGELKQDILRVSAELVQFNTRYFANPDEVSQEEKDWAKRARRWRGKAHVAKAVLSREINLRYEESDLNTRLKKRKEYLLELGAQVSEKTEEFQRLTSINKELRNKNAQWEANIENPDSNIRRIRSCAVLIKAFQEVMLNAILMAKLEKEGDTDGVAKRVTQNTVLIKTLDNKIAKLVKDGVPQEEIDNFLSNAIIPKTIRDAVESGLK